MTLTAQHFRELARDQRRTLGEILSEDLEKARLNSHTVSNLEFWIHEWFEMFLESRGTEGNAELRETAEKKVCENLRVLRKLNPDLIRQISLKAKAGSSIAEALKVYEQRNRPRKINRKPRKAMRHARRS